MTLACILHVLIAMVLNIYTEVAAVQDGVGMDRTAVVGADIS